jgi:transaldolase
MADALGELSKAWRSGSTTSATPGWPRAAAAVMAALVDVGIDYDDVVDKLEHDGLTTFQASWAALTENLEQKLAAANAAAEMRTIRYD